MVLEKKSFYFTLAGYLKEHDMVVLKFGGTSVQNGEYIDRALDIAEKQLDSAPLLVSSAMGKTTDALVAITDLAEQGMFSEAEKELAVLKDKHFSVADGFLTGQQLDDCRRAIDELYLQLIALVRGSSLLHECSPRSRDAILSFGELLATTIIYYRALARGMDAQWIDSRECIITDDNFTSAAPDFDATNKAIKKHVKPHRGRLIIAQGFISRTAEGTTTTLGRGGSDYTAAIFGAALKAEEVQIWTDVNGILTSDPRLVPAARTIDKITYDEAAELAFFGAKVVHPSTIQPAIRHGIPVWVKNSGNPEHPGTLISAEVTGSGLRAIAGKKGVTLMNVSSSRMLNAYGFLSRIFSIFNTYKTSVDLVATSEVSVSMTIDNTRYLKEISEELEKLGQVKIVQKASIICMVGFNLWRDSAFIARAFSALEGIPIEMVSLGASDINLSCVVPDEYADQAIRTLHEKLLEER